MLADFIFILNFSLKYRFDCVQEPLATYRYHFNQMSFKYSTISAFQHLKWLKTNSEVKKFKSFKEFVYLVNKINFIQLLNLIKKSKNLNTLKKILLYPNNNFKLKLLLKFFIPEFIFLIFFGNLY